MITPHIISVQRQDLYDCVWKYPEEDVVKQYGVSETTIRNMCLRGNVPMPGWTYWGHLRNGKAVSKEPLPEPEKNPIITVVYKRIVIEDEAHWQKAQELIKHEELTENAIVVPPLPAQPAPIILATRAKLMSVAADGNGIQKAQGPNILNISVSKPLIDRAIRIASALVNEFSKRHMELIPQNHGFGVKVLDEVIDIAIEEVLASGPNGGGKSPYEPSGKLRICLDSKYYFEWVRRTWADARYQRVETCLNAVITGMLYASVAIRSVRLPRERWEKQLKEQKEWEAKEKKNVELLDTLLDQWRRCQDVRTLTAAIRERYAKHGQLIQDKSPLGEWLTWAEEHADELDPIKVPECGIN